VVVPSDDVTVAFGHNGCDTRNDILRRDTAQHHGQARHELAERQRRVSTRNQCPSGPHTPAAGSTSRPGRPARRAEHRLVVAFPELPFTAITSSDGHRVRTFTARARAADDEFPPEVWVRLFLPERNATIHI